MYFALIQLDSKFDHACVCRVGCKIDCLWHLLNLARLTSCICIQNPAWLSTFGREDAYMHHIVILNCGWGYSGKLKNHMFLMPSPWVPTNSQLHLYPFLCSRFQRKKHAEFNHYTPEQEKSMLTMMDELTTLLTNRKKTDFLSLDEYKIRS